MRWNSLVASLSTKPKRYKISVTLMRSRWMWCDVDFLQWALFNPSIFTVAGQKCERLGCIQFLFLVDGQCAGIGQILIMELILLGTYSERDTKNYVRKNSSAKERIPTKRIKVKKKRIEVQQKGSKRNIQKNKHQPFRAPLDVIVLLRREFSRALQPLGQFQTTAVFMNGPVIQPTQILFHNLVLVLGIWELITRRLVLLAIIYLVHYRFHLHHSHISSIIHSIFLGQTKEFIRCQWKKIVRWLFLRHFIDSTKRKTPLITLPAWDLCAPPPSRRHRSPCHSPHRTCASGAPMAVDDPHSRAAAAGTRCSRWRAQTCLYHGARRIYSRCSRCDAPRPPKCCRSNKCWTVRRCRGHCCCSSWSACPRFSFVALCRHFSICAANWRTNYRSVSSRRKSRISEWKWVTAKRFKKESEWRQNRRGPEIHWLTCM